METFDWPALETLVDSLNVWFSAAPSDDMETTLAAIRTAAEAGAWLCQVAAMGIGWLCGAFSFKYILYVKNHKDVW